MPSLWRPNGLGQHTLRHALRPTAFFVGVILMLLGHVIGGLALFGASILAAGAVVIAGLSGARAGLRRREVRK